MRQRIRAIRQSDSGFTLIELLIVIVILGVLAGVVVFAVNGITDRGVEAACKADKKTVEVAAEAYYAKNSTYPTDTTDDARLAALVTAKLLKQPPSKDHYTITLSDTGVVGPAVCPTS